MLIDFQCHWTTEEYFASLVGREDYPRATRRDDGYYVEFRPNEARFFPPRFFDLDLHIEDLDRHGVDVMVSSPTHSDVSGLPRAAAVSTVQMLNRATSEAQRSRPDRFAGLAVLPMEHPDDAVREVHRALGDLHLRGVCLFANTGGERLVTPETMRVFAAIAEAGVPLFLHPTSSMLVDKGMGDAIERGLHWMHDTSAAALSLIYGGVLDAHPELQVVHPHAGGVLPYVISRIEFMEMNTFSDVAGSQRSLSVREYLKRNFWADCVNDTPGALELAADLYGADRLLYASDFPYFDRSKILRHIDTLEDRSMMTAAGPSSLTLART